MPGDFIAALPVNAVIHPAGLPTGTSTIKVLRRPVESAQYVSWAFGHRLREAGLLGSMESVGDCFDNSVAESFFATLQAELLDPVAWATREQLANAVFAFIEAFCDPRRRHSTLGYLNHADCESQHRAGQPTEAAA